MHYDRPETFVAVSRPTIGAKLRAAGHWAWQAYLGWLARQAVRRTLSELDDRMLKDIGITRGEIEAIARGYKPRRERPTIWRAC